MEMQNACQISRTFFGRMWNKDLSCNDLDGYLDPSGSARLLLAERWRILKQTAGRTARLCVKQIQVSGTPALSGFSFFPDPMIFFPLTNT